MSDILQLTVVGIPLLIAVLVGFSKRYWTGYRDGFRDVSILKGTGDV